MNTSIPMLLAVIVSARIAPWHAAQETSAAEVGSRRPVDVSIEGLGRAPRWRPGVGASRHDVEPPALPGTVSLRFLDCVGSVADQATRGCLSASSTPSLGTLYPYPGVDNVFEPPAFVGGGQHNEATEPWATVAGGRNNVASGASVISPSGYATVGGGLSNTASGATATVAGGLDNRARGISATVSGGHSNDADGTCATVGGGCMNGAVGSSATVGGGLSNGAGFYATVGGGKDNRASGLLATIPGGTGNIAQGNYSFAAGARAAALHMGAFVWGDSRLGSPSAKSSFGEDTFNVYCSGGAWFFSNSARNTGVRLPSGGGSWSSFCDRESKENIEPVEGRAVLERLVSLPLATWNYKAQGDSIRHMGPMAQDFREAFGLGDNDKTIDTIDADGVALAAIQGMSNLLREKDAEIDRNRAAIEELQSRLAVLEAELMRLTTFVSKDETAAR